MSLGLTIATEAEFLLQRERVHNTIPKLYLCSDGHSVTSNVDDTVEWMLTLEHIVAMLRRVTILTTIIGNDGALPLPVPLALPTLCVAISIFCNQPHVPPSLPPSRPLTRHATARHPKLAAVAWSQHQDRQPAPKRAQPITEPVQGGAARPSGHGRVGGHVSRVLRARHAVPRQLSATL